MWTDKEDSILLEFMKECKRISEISNILDKTPNDIRIRIETLVVEYYYTKNYTISEIELKTNLNKVDIANIIEENKDKFVLKQIDSKSVGWFSNIWSKFFK